MPLQDASTDALGGSAFKKECQMNTKTTPTMTPGALANPAESEDPYCLEPGPEVSAEELRRDRLAHFLLTGLRLVMEAESRGGK